MILDSWLADISPEAPCGPDLAYDADYLALEVAGTGKPDQQFGEVKIPAEEPVWAEVVARASALMDRTKDLRVIVLLARGLTRTQGLGGLAEALTLIRDLLERYWEPLHPSLEFEGEPDPIVRMNALTGLADAQTLRAVRDAELFRNPSTRLQVRDAETILDAAKGTAEGGAGMAELRAAIFGEISANAQALDAPQAIVEAVRRIQSNIVSKLDPTALPDLAPLSGLLKPIAALIESIRAEVIAAPAEQAAAGGAGSETVGVGGPFASGAQAVGDIRSRADALRALDRVCDFLGRNEPTNPAPLFIRRAQRLMTMPFMDIVRELAPDAAPHVEMVTGSANKT